MKSRIAAFIIVLILLLPINVIASETYCKYSKTSSISLTQGDETTEVYLYFECDASSCHYTRMTISSTFYNFGGGYNDTKFKGLTSCPQNVGATHPQSSGIALMSPESSCSGRFEYGCYPLRENNVKPNVEIDASDKYKDIQSCKAATYKYIKQCGCMPAALTDLTSRLYMLIKIAAPTLLLIVGGFDLVKAMSAQDEKAIKKAQQKLVKKFVAAAAVFLILTVVQFLVSTLSNNTKNTLECLDYLLNGYVA